MVKPTSITMDCASHDATIQEIKWTKWTQQAAYGTGRIKEKVPPHVPYPLCYLDLFKV